MTYPLWQPTARSPLQQMLELFVRQSGFTLEELREKNNTVIRIRARRIVAKKMFAERFNKAQIGRFLHRDPTVIGDYLKDARRSAMKTVAEKRYAAEMESVGA